MIKWGPEVISPLDMTKALYGAYRLARADTGGMSYLNTSLEGFWQSFFAAVLVAPLFFLLLIIRFNVSDIGASVLRFFALEGIAYVIGWILFPLVVFYLAQVLERERQYCGFIVAYNWASVLQNAIYLPFAILFELGMVGGSSAELVNLTLLCLVLAYTWFVTKTALNVAGIVACGVVILDVGLWIIVNLLTASMLRLPV